MSDATQSERLVIWTISDNENTLQVMDKITFSTAIHPVELAELTVSVIRPWLYQIYTPSFVENRIVRR